MIAQIAGKWSHHEGAKERASQEPRCNNSATDGAVPRNMFDNHGRFAIVELLNVYAHPDIHG